MAYFKKCPTCKQELRSEKLSESLIREVLEFASLNSFVINPEGYQYTLNGYAEFQHCPCDKKRPKCPCDKAAQEVETQGHCKCELFWKSYLTYWMAKHA